MFILITICVIIALASLALASYFYADAKGKVKIIDKQNELLEYFKTELSLWQNKALTRHGTSPLGWETRPKAEKTETATVTPRTVLRSEMEARDAAQNAHTGVNLHTTGVSYNRVRREDVIEKAGEIINAGK